MERHQKQTSRLLPLMVLACSRHSMTAPWVPPWQVRTIRTSIEGSGKDLVLHVVTEKLQWSPAGRKIGRHLRQIHTQPRCPREEHNSLSLGADSNQPIKGTAGVLFLPIWPHCPICYRLGAPSPAPLAAPQTLCFYVLGRADSTTQVQ